MTDRQRCLLEKCRQTKSALLLSRWPVHSVVVLLILLLFANESKTVVSQKEVDTEGEQGECQASQQTQDGSCSSTVAAAAAAAADTPECGIWLAPSSLPGAGLGMYAGRDFMAGENLQHSGDVVIPFVDINHHQFERSQAGQFHLLWDEYTVRHFVA